MLLHAGEIWAIQGRKGGLSIKLLEEVDTEVEAFFQAELVEGAPVYASRAVDPDEVGDEMTFRTTLTRFITRLK